MPLTYEEYKKNKEIQPTLAGLEIDSDKFWFLLLLFGTTHKDNVSMPKNLPRHP